MENDAHKQRKPRNVRNKFKEYSSFISTENQKAFNSICGSCSSQNHCDKGKAAIVLKCDNFKNKYSKDKIKVTPKKRKSYY